MLWIIKIVVSVEGVTWYVWVYFCDTTQKLKLWWNSKTQIVIKLKNSNYDQTQKLKLWKNSKTKIVIKLNFWQNSSCDKTQIVTKLKLWQNSLCDKTQIVRKNQKLKCYKSQIVTIVTVMIKVTEKIHKKTQNLKL